MQALPATPKAIIFRRFLIKMPIQTRREMNLHMQNISRHIYIRAVYLSYPPASILVRSKQKSR